MLMDKPQKQPSLYTKANLKKLYSETNDKFVGRVEKLLYYVNGCDLRRGKLILEMCLKRNKSQQHEINLKSKIGGRGKLKLWPPSIHPRKSR
jgi:hypothetical protein